MGAGVTPPPQGLPDGLEVGAPLVGDADDLALLDQLAHAGGGLGAAPAADIRDFLGQLGDGALLVLRQAQEVLIDGGAGFLSLVGVGGGLAVLGFLGQTGGESVQAFQNIRGGVRQVFDGEIHSRQIGGLGGLDFVTHGINSFLVFWSVLDLLCLYYSTLIFICQEVF